jgi:superfamily I DNA/RNA helicase
LARTNRELIPAVVVAVARGISFRAARLELPLEHASLDGLLERASAMARPGESLLVVLGRLRDSTTEAVEVPLVAALLTWAPPYPDLPTFTGAVHDARDRLASLRRDDASLTLATAHATKGLEFDHVVILGMEAARFPSAKAVEGATDPARAYEEERRLAYVAWTRARRTLTILYDPAAASPFLLEAFTPEELGLGISRATG